MFGLENHEVVSAQLEATKPQHTVFDLRDGKSAQKIVDGKLAEISGNRRSQHLFEQEAKALDAEIEATLKIQKTLDDPAVDLKISQLREQKKYALDGADRNKRIADSREGLLERWLGEGEPTNRELIERRKKLSKL